MINEGFLKAQRPLARHSQRLAVAPPAPEDLGAGLAAGARRLRLVLADALRPLLGGELAAVQCSKVERVAAPRLHKMIDPVAVNLLLEEPGGAQVMVSLSYADALVLTDQVFGGRGEAPALVPERLPAATDLTIVRLADALGDALGKTFERGSPLKLTLRSDVLGKLVRARDEEQFLTLRCEVTLEGRTPWEVLLVLRQHQAQALLADGARTGATRPAVAGGANPLDAPFAEMPLDLVAVLAEMRMPVARLSSLKPGDVIPLAISGEVPLRFDKVVIARGQAGTIDGTLALRLTRLARCPNSSDPIHSEKGYPPNDR